MELITDPKLAPRRSGPPDARPSDPRIDRVLALIHAAPEERWTLRRLADEAGLSRFYFLRLFRRVVGETPHAYLERKRLDVAKDLLRRGHAIADIAVRVGFFDQSHFTNRFRLAFAVTPRRYQRYGHAIRPHGRATDAHTSSPNVA